MIKQIALNARGKDLCTRHPGAEGPGPPPSTAPWLHKNPFCFSTPGALDSSPPASPPTALNCLFDNSGGYFVSMGSSHLPGWVSRGHRSYITHSAARLYPALAHGRPIDRHLLLRKELAMNATEVSPPCHRLRQGETHHSGRLCDPAGFDTWPGDAQFPDEEES